MDIKEMMRLQREFDEHHASRFEWYAAISERNLDALAFLLVSLTGELGELANTAKKVLRGDTTVEGAKLALTEEAADVFIYLLKFCMQLDIDLEAAFVRKLEANRRRFTHYEKRHTGSEDTEGRP